MAVKADPTAAADAEAGVPNAAAGSGAATPPGVDSAAEEEAVAEKEKMMKKKKGKEEEEEEEEEDMPKRDHVTWANHWVFVFSLMSFTINVHSIWTFPYLMYSNGGIAFLIPYIGVTLVVALPLQFLELFIGQVRGKDRAAWSLSRIFC